MIIYHSSLSKEAAIRYATFENQLKLTKNIIVDAALGVGNQQIARCVAKGTPQGRDLG